MFKHIIWTLVLISFGGVLMHETHAAVIIERSGKIKMTGSILGEETHVSPTMIPTNTSVTPTQTPSSLSPTPALLAITPSTHPSYAVDDYWNRPSPIVDDYWNRPSPVVDDWWNRTSPTPGGGTIYPTRDPSLTPYPPIVNDDPRLRLQKSSAHPSTTPAPHRQAITPTHPTLAWRPKPSPSVVFLKLENNAGQEAQISPAEEVFVETTRGNIRLKRDSASDRIEFFSGGVLVGTKLPLMIHTDTHVVSAQTAAGAQIPVSVLPDDLKSRLITDPETQSFDATLVEEDGTILYKVEEKKQEKILGLLPVQIKRHLKMSVQDGSVISQDQTIIDTLMDSIAF